jgi:anti-sigma regulatory factor (Ser/Thr protein kinase)
MTNAGTDYMPELAAPPSSAARQDRPTSSAGICDLRASPSRPKRRVFPGRPDQVASARHFVSRFLARCPAAADAILLTSELVTNALQHTATGMSGNFEVTACHCHRGIRITVTDEGSDHVPALVRGTLLPTSGQGLLLVTALATRWGHLGDEQGRSVWFELDCR